MLPASLLEEAINQPVEKLNYMYQKLLFFPQIIDIAEVRYIRELGLLRNLNLLGNPIQVFLKSVYSVKATKYFAL